MQYMYNIKFSILIILRVQFSDIIYNYIDYINYNYIVQPPTLSISETFPLQQTKWFLSSISVLPCFWNF